MNLLRKRGYILRSAVSHFRGFTLHPPSLIIADDTARASLYCWGGDIASKTNRDNYDSRRLGNEGIAISDSLEPYKTPSR